MLLTLCAEVKHRQDVAVLRQQRQQQQQQQKLERMTRLRKRTNGAVWQHSFRQTEKGAAADDLEATKLECEEAEFKEEIIRQRSRANSLKIEMFDSEPSVYKNSGDPVLKSPTKPAATVMGTPTCNRGWFADTNRWAPCPPSILRDINASHVTAHSITLTWTDGDDGGAEVTQYNIIMHNDRMLPTRTLTAAPDTLLDGIRAFTVSSLIPHNIYNFTVTAINICGLGPISNDVDICTSTAAPDAPEQVTVDDITATTVRLCWKAPCANGCGIRGYAIHHRINNNGGFTQHTLNTYSNKTVAVVRGLRSDCVYEFCVYALNRVGGGPPSDATDTILLPPEQERELLLPKLVGEHYH